MKKFAKMSLVAAVAVAGTVASAQPLAEAIKNVDVSGTVVYRYDDSTLKNGTSTVTNKYKIGLTAKAKVNDDVTAVTRFIVGADDNGFVAPGGNTQSGADSQANVALSNVYFSYTGIANTTVNVGKQGLTTPWTVAIDADGNEQTGTGILALTNVGPVTVAGAYFNQNNITGYGDEDIATIGVMGNVGPVALDAWYLDMSDSFDSFTVGAAAKFDLDAVKLGVDLRYTDLDLDNSDVDNNMIKLALTAKMGIFNAKYSFAKTDKEGGLVSLDNDAKTTTLAWGVNPSGKADATFHHFRVGAQVLPSLHLEANYAEVDYQASTTNNKEDSQEEIYAQLTYKMSKNFSTYLRYGTQENKIEGADTDTDYKGRIQVQYSF